VFDDHHSPKVRLNTEEDKQKNGSSHGDSFVLWHTDFLCSFEDNTYGIDFLAFKIQDNDTGKTVFEVSKNPDAPPPVYVV
jgi:hypothetical protein